MPPIVMDLLTLTIVLQATPTEQTVPPVAPAQPVPAKYIAVSAF